TPVTAIELEGDRVAAVVTSAGRIETRTVVNAAGPQAALVGRMVGLELPVDPRRRHIFVTDEFAGVRHPMPLVIDRASGFCCHGFQHSPATGQVVSEILTGSPPSIDIRDLSITRF